MNASFSEDPHPPSHLKKGDNHLTYTSPLTPPTEAPKNLSHLKNFTQ